MILAGFGGQLGHVEVGVAEPTGQVRLDRREGRGHLGLHVAQIQQHRCHLVGRVGGDTGLFDGGHDGVVVAHQSGAAGPADQRVRQADPCRPGRLGVPAAHDGVQRRLGFAVSAVTAEHSAVGRTGQHHVQPRRDVTFGADRRQAADQPLHGPQQHLHLHLGARARLRQVTDDTRRREREQQRRGLRVLDVNRLRPKAFALLVTDPLDQCVDVGVGRHVGRDHPQRRRRTGRGRDTASGRTPAARRRAWTSSR